MKTIPVLLSAALVLLLTAAATFTDNTQATIRGVRGIYNQDSDIPTSSLRANLEVKAAQYNKATRSLGVIASDDVRRTIEEVQLKEVLGIPHNVMTPDGTLFGGISGVTYDKDRKVYYALTNDVEEGDPTTHAPHVNVVNKVMENPDVAEASAPIGRWGNTPSQPHNRRPRFYTLEFDDLGNAKVLDVTFLRNANHQEYNQGSVLPQAIAYADDQLYISLDRGPNTDMYWQPEIIQFNTTGYEQGRLHYPSYFRHSVGFTALTITPQDDILVAATGKGLQDDRPEYIRFVEFDLATRQSGKQYVYQAEDTVVGIVSLDDNGGFAVLERSGVIPEYNPDRNVHSNPSVSVTRSAAPWEGYDATLYYALTLDAINVESINDLKNVHTLNTMRRETMYEFRNVTKYEAMGNDAGFRRKEDNKETEKSQRGEKKTKKEKGQRDLSSKKNWYDEIDVIIMSDNQFQINKPTDVLIVQLDAKETAVLNPVVETTEVLDDGASGKAALDPAIWVHPTHPEQSLILTALSMRDIGVYSLTGELTQTVGNDGNSMGIDVLYAFKLGDDNLVDLAIVSDGTNDRLRVYKIQSDDGNNYLTGISDGGMPTIEDPKGVAGYHSPYTGKQYAFVQSREEHFIVQVELRSTSDQQRVTGSVVREIYLPSRSGGLVVDNELGYLYVSLADNPEQGIIKYDAEPNEYKDSENYPTTVLGGNKEDYVPSGIKGLTLYYGDQGTGFLVLSVSGESRFAVFEREGNNEYYDSFIIGKNRDNGIDKTDNTQGVAITNVKLGSQFQCGLFVAQDSDNQQAKVDGLPTGELVNSNTNFKLVPFEEVAENMYYHLDVDIDSWDPRRFSLVVWINTIGQGIYTALYHEDLSGRDAENLLSYLNAATSHLYPRSAKKQQMMSLINPFDNDAKRRKLVTTKEERIKTIWQRIREDELRTETERRELKKKECKHRRRLAVSPGDAEDDLQGFIDHLESLNQAGRISEYHYNSWKALAGEIKHEIPNPH